jgi:tRNA threonylcarbamoyladenosine biosynthesis protein TsaB
MAIILAIETSATDCSVALCQHGTITQILEHTPQQHGQHVLAMVAKLLATHQLSPSAIDAIAYGRGPGSFTGLRIAAAVTQGLTFGLARPAIAVSTLAGLAYRAWIVHGWNTVLAIIDARIGEVYWAYFEITNQGIVMPLSEEALTRPEQITPLTTQSVLSSAGSGWMHYSDHLTRQLGLTPQNYDASLRCQAHDIGSLAHHQWLAGHLSRPEQALPVYLRDHVATKPTT